MVGGDGARHLPAPLHPRGGGTRGGGGHGCDWLAELSFRGVTGSKVLPFAERNMVAFSLVGFNRSLSLLEICLLFSRGLDQMEEEHQEANLWIWPK